MTGYVLDLSKCDEKYLNKQVVKEIIESDRIATIHEIIKNSGTRLPIKSFLEDIKPIKVKPKSTHFDSNAKKLTKKRCFVEMEEVSVSYVPKELDVITAIDRGNSREIIFLYGGRLYKWLNGELFSDNPLLDEIYLEVSKKLPTIKFIKLW